MTTSSSNFCIRNVKKARDTILVLFFNLMHEMVSKSSVLSKAKISYQCLSFSLGVFLISFEVLLEMNDRGNFGDMKVFLADINNVCSHLFSC